MRIPARLLAAAALSAAALQAQTFVVDQANGPGTSFTDLPAAVAAVPSGATLIVRAGLYTAPVVAMGLTILADPNVRFSGTFIVSATAASQSVVLSRLISDGATAFASASNFRIQNCAGPVLLADCSFLPTIPTMGNPLGVSISSSSQVVVRGGQWTACSVNQSNVAFEEASIFGWSGGSACGLCGSHFPSTGLEVIGPGEVTVTGGTIVGGNEYPGLSATYPAQPGIRTSGALRLLGNLVVRVSSNCGLGACVTGAPAVEVVAGGSVRVDPGVALLGTATPQIQGGPAVVAAMPHATSTSAGLGGQLAAQAPGPAGLGVILIFGFPGAPIALPGLVGDFWLDPTLPYEFAALGVAPISASVTVPNVALFLGVRVGWHSVAFGTAAGIEVSNPTWALIR